jgi:hypothetical protein
MAVDHRWQEVHMLTAAVSGSFRRHMGPITEAVHELVGLSVRVLSPADPRVVEKQGEFWYVASDPIRSIKLVQDRHLESIRVADFVWLVCPDGYVGQSASMEIGYAAGAGVRIFADHAPCDLTLREYVTVLPSLSEAVRKAASEPRQKPGEGILIDPRASVDKVHRTLERIEAALTRPSSLGDPAHQVRSEVADVRSILALPTYTH